MTAALCATDVWIEFNHQWLLYSTPFERASEVNRKLRYMCLVDFNEELLIRTVGHVDTPKLQVFMRKVAERTRNARTMHVTTPAGTDVTFEIDPVHYVACDCGDATFPAAHMLTGQINVVPKFGSIEGTIVFDGCVTPPCGQGTVSHSDGICLNSTVWLDGQCIMREGAIVDKELSALDPTV